MIHGTVVLNTMQSLGKASLKARLLCTNGSLLHSVAMMAAHLLCLTTVDSLAAALVDLDQPGGLV